MDSSSSPTHLGSLLRSPSTWDLEYHIIQCTQAQVTPSKQTPQTSFADVCLGAAEVFERITTVLTTKDVVVVALGGPSRSGKGFMEKELQRLAAEKSIGIGTIPMDWFYLLKEQRHRLGTVLGKEITFDDPESLWYERLQHTIRGLQEGIPVKDIIFSNYLYDHQGVERAWQECPEELQHYQGNKRILIIDGIFAGHPMSGIALLADIKVHMEADGATQAARRINADRERGRDIIDAADILLDFVVQKRSEHIDPYKHLADIYIENTMPPQELMKRTQCTQQQRFLLPAYTSQQIHQFIERMHTMFAFIEQGQWSFIDMYANIPKRHEEDFARLRITQGHKGIAQTAFSIALRGKKGEEYKGNYPLYPGVEHLQKYITGMHVCMQSTHNMLVSKKRILLIHKGIEICIDTDIHVSVMQTTPTFSQQRIIPPHPDEVLPAQIKIVHGSDTLAEQIAKHITELFGAPLRTTKNTFHRARHTNYPAK